MLKRTNVTLNESECEDALDKATREMSIDSLSALIRYLIKAFLKKKPRSK